MSVQNNFWKYLSKKMREPSLQFPQIFFERTLGNIKFRCINTAWTSKLKEEQGKLRVVSESNFSDAPQGVVISMFHHPYNWINSSDMAVMRDQIESISVISLSGHEHAADVYTKVRINGGTAYIEAGALLENSIYSRFNYIDIDFDNSKLDIYTNRVKLKDHFVEIESNSQIFSGDLRNISSRPALLNKEFKDEINRFGSFIIVSDEGDLNKLYIYPNLEKIDISRKKKDPTVVNSKDVLQEMIKETKIVLHGESNSGKTSLSRKIFIDLYDENFYPILIDYLDVKKRGLENTLEESIKKQYSNIDKFKYLQIDKEKRVLIIDNVSSTYNDEIDKSSIENIENDFGKVIIFSNVDPVENMIKRLKENVASSYTRFKILGLNPFLRRKIIESMLEISIGSASLVKDKAYYQKVAEIESAIDTSLRSRLISAYPIYVIGILQYYIQSNGKSVAGSNNFVYDLLVKMSLTGISNNDSEYSIYETFLSYLAFNFLSEGIDEMDQDSINDFIDNYISDFSFRGVIDGKSLISTLISSNILKFDSSYSFKHRHLIYYFAAIYLRNYRSDASQSKFVEKMLKELNSTSYLNTVAFLIYLNRDYSIVEDIMSYVEFLINTLPEKTITDLKYEISTKSKVVDEAIRSAFDKHSDESIDTSDIENQDKLQEEAGEDIKIVITSLRVLDLLGEVVKNHVGSWEGAKKQIIVEFCYKVSKKVSGHFYYRIDELIKDIAVGETQKLASQDSINDIKDMNGIKRADLNSVINRNIYGFLEIISAGLINRVAAAVATPKMREIYPEILRGSSTPDYKLIDATVAMNTSSSFPETKIVALAKEFEENKFISRTIRNLVHIHFSNFPTKRITVDKVMGALDIKMDEKSFVQAISKKKR